MYRFIFITALTVQAGIATAQVPQVVADIAPVQGLVAQVMGDLGTPELLLPRTASPHSYAMRPSDARALGAADIVVWVGPGLSPWLQEPLNILAAQATQLELMQVDDVQLLPFRTGARFDNHDHDAHEHEHGAHDHESHDHADEAVKEENHDHSHDDGHDHAEEKAASDTAHDGHTHVGSDDPHIWLDPYNAMAILTAVAEALAGLDPGNAETYRDNARFGIQEIKNEYKKIRASLEPYQGQPFAVLHDAFYYFEARFGLQASAAISLADGGAASVAHLDGVRATIAQTGAKCVLSEPQVQSGLIDAAAAGTNIHVEILYPFGEETGAEMNDYMQNLKGMSAGFVRCLSAK